MADLEKFVHDDSRQFPELLKIALVHYQFETIHPFLDGNGRVGRLLITLYLVSKGIVKRPVLYLSDFFERNRSHYYDNETARNGIATFDKILKLQQDVEKRIGKLGSRAANAQKVVHYLYQRPLVDAARVSEVTSLSPASAYKLIVDMEKLGILKEITGGKHGKRYVFGAYLQMFQ